MKKILALLVICLGLSGCSLNPDRGCDSPMRAYSHTPRDLYQCFKQFDREASTQKQIGGY